MDNLLFIILILIAIWYWWDTQQCNEMALAMCQQKCSRAGLQLLDATVIRQRTWLRRGKSGSVQICRLYSFEYNGPSHSEQAADSVPAEFGVRNSGYIVLIGKQVVETNMPHDNVDKQLH